MQALSDMRSSNSFISIFLGSTFLDPSEFTLAVIVVGISWLRLLGRSLRKVCFLARESKGDDDDDDPMHDSSLLADTVLVHVGVRTRNGVVCGN